MNPAEALIFVVSFMTFFLGLYCGAGHKETAEKQAEYFRKVAVEWYAEAQRLNDELLYLKAIEGEEWKYR